jgi:multicomponent Na+:H+ antiporter subunit A
MLAFASPGTAAWGFAGTWLLVFAVGKTALLACAAALARTFGERSLRALRGWARRAPLLATALALIAVSTIGLPGLAAFDARLGLVRGALAEPLSSLVLIASLASIAIPGRLLVTGLGRPTSLVKSAPDERPRRPKPDLRLPAAATARETLDANRAPLSAGLVLALACLATAVGAGAFGLQEAAVARMPAPLPGAEPGPGVIPTFRPIPTDAASPSG